VAAKRIGDVKVRVEVYRRTPGSWEHVIVTEGAVALETVGVPIPMDEIYA